MLAFPVLTGIVPSFLLKELCEIQQGTGTSCWCMIARRINGRVVVILVQVLRFGVLKADRSFTLLLCPTTSLSLVVGFELCRVVRNRSTSKPIT